VAQYLWHQADTIERAAPFLPPINIVKNTTPLHERNFAQANLDSQNPSVIREDGSREPPPFQPYVDDNLYGNTEENVLQGLCSSLLSLYESQGYPTINQPDSFSDLKLNKLYTHLRRILGEIFDTRQMTASLPDDRRAELIVLLDQWSVKLSFTLIEACGLFGSLQSACETCHWAKPCLYTLQNLLSAAIRKAYVDLKIRQRHQGIRATILEQLSPRDDGARAIPP
jgi:hypothetical protein